MDLTLLAQRIMPMSQWQYRTIHLSDLARKTDEIDLLNSAGENGWQLVGITTNNTAYLKRQIPEPTGPSASSPRRKTTTASG
jgi:hypothetical protein